MRSFYIGIIKLPYLCGTVYNIKYTLSKSNQPNVMYLIPIPKIISIIISSYFSRTMYVLPKYQYTDTNQTKNYLSLVRILINKE